jgi:acyl-coenzyme A thioesterase PaaI-like protein
VPDDASAGDPLSAIMAEVRKRPPDERMLARRRTADALRSLIEVALDGDIDPEALHALAGDLERVLDATTLQPATSRYGAASEGPSVLYLMNETHPIGGIGNPIAMPFTPVMDGDTLRADLHFGPAYEGTPGLVHGGFVAATFDHLLGGAAIRVGRPIVTGSLTVRYLRPTPLNTHLTIECWPGKSAGRKVMTHGRLLDGEVVLVEAEALFITVDVTRYTPPAEGGAVPSRKTVSAPGSEDDTLGTAS